ncbi:MAG: NAD(+)/NADH kinase [Desulfurococcales archaeon]|nr:NAD(+)/NADH kinase [Desulfurococcales archaeon]
MTGKIIGLVVKPNSVLAEETAKRVVTALEKYKLKILVEEKSKPYEFLSKYDTFKLRENPPTWIIAVGGDGTLLRTFQKLCRDDITVMGIRAGRRGFLLDVEPYEIEDRIKDFIEGKYRVYRYTRLDVRVGSKKLPCTLNDAVIVGKMAKVIRLNVFRDGERIYSIDGDGLIVSTTVGSTAYNLSAGGPIIDPGLDSVSLAPMNPVQIQLRPVVLPAISRIRIELRPASKEAWLILDGQHVEDVYEGDIIDIEKSQTPAVMARFKWWENYYERVFTRILSYW